MGRNVLTKPVLQIMNTGWRSHCFSGRCRSKRFQISDFRFKISDLRFQITGDALIFEKLS